MNHLKKSIITAVLAVSMTLGLLLGSTQHCEAQYYRNYYNLYAYYNNLYSSSRYTPYYYLSLAYLWYYYGGLYCDYTGYTNDRYGYKSTNYARSTYASYYLNLYCSYGDYYSRL